MRGRHTSNIEVCSLLHNLPASRSCADASKTRQSQGEKTGTHHGSMIDSGTSMIRVIGMVQASCSVQDRVGTMEEDDPIHRLASADSQLLMQ